MSLDTRSTYIINKIYMSEHPKFLGDLEQELASGTLSELLGKAPEVDPAEVQIEKNHKQIEAMQAKKASLLLRILMERGIVLKDMTAEELVYFLNDYAKELWGEVKEE